jgi:hypothetical protein
MSWSSIPRTGPCCEVRLGNSAGTSLLGEQFLVLYGDSYLPCDYRAVERAFRER